MVENETTIVRSRAQLDQEWAQFVTAMDEGFTRAGAGSDEIVNTAQRFYDILQMFKDPQCDWNLNPAPGMALIAEVAQLGFAELFLQTAVREADIQES